MAAQVNGSHSAGAGDCVTAMGLAEYPKLLAGAANSYIVIQCTSVGLAPGVDDVVIEDSDFYRRVKYGYDLIYTPWETRFMRLVKENGGMAYNGLKMLLYQGVEAFELWNGCQVTKKIEDQIYRRLCERFK